MIQKVYTILIIGYLITYRILIPAIRKDNITKESNITKPRVAFAAICLA